MKREAIDENEVFAAADALLAAGEKVTVANIRMKIGGGNQTIAPLKRKWEEMRVLGRLSAIEPSSGFNNALLQEFGRITRTVQETFENKIQQTEKDCQEALELLKKSEDNNRALSENLAEAEKQNKALQHTNDTIIETNKNLQKKNSELDSKLSESEKLREKAIVENSKIIGINEQLKKDIDKLEKQLGELTTKFEKTDEALKKAEIDAATAKGRLAEIEKQATRK